MRSGSSSKAMTPIMAAGKLQREFSPRHCQLQACPRAASEAKCSIGPWSFDVRQVDQAARLFMQKTRSLGFAPQIARESKNSGHRLFLHIESKFNHVP